MLVSLSKEIVDILHYGDAVAAALEEIAKYVAFDEYDVLSYESKPLERWELLLLCNGVDIGKVVVIFTDDGVDVHLLVK